MSIITPPPTIPNRNDPTTFPARADDYVAWWATVADEINDGALMGFATVAALLADESDARGAGAIWEAGGFRYAESAPSATDQHITTAGGVKLYVLPGADGSVTPEQFGASGDGVSDDSVSIEKFFNFAGSLKLPKGHSYLVTRVILVTVSGGRLSGGGKIVAGPATGFASVADFDAHRPLVGFAGVDDWVIEGCQFDTTAWIALPPSASSARALHFRLCSNCRVNGNDFAVKSGAISFNGGENREIVGNRIAVFQMGSLPDVPADGVIDLWGTQGVDLAREIISNNVIQGGGFGRWGIMLTGQAFSPWVSDVDGVTISGNIIEDVVFDGIWAFGRNAEMRNANIFGNTVRRARSGISVSDARNCKVTGNLIQTCTGIGIYLWRETANGGTLGVIDSTIQGNTLIDVASGGTSSNPALWARFGGNLAIQNNAILGDTHGLGIVVSSDAPGCDVRGNTVNQGRGSSYSLSDGTRTDGALYTPTLTGVANVTSVTLERAFYWTTSSRVRVSMRMAVAPTSTGVATTIRVSLPIPTDVVTGSLFGHGATSRNAPVICYHDSSNDEAIVEFNPASALATAVYVSFDYEIR